MFLTESYPVSISQLSTCKLLRQITSATRPYLVSIWRMDPEIKMQQYVSNPILSGFYEAVVELRIVKANHICYSTLPACNLTYGSGN